MCLASFIQMPPFEPKSRLNGLPARRTRLLFEDDLLNNLNVLNNKAILDSPVILFLGAGASAPLGKPMMAEFVDKISKTMRTDGQREMLQYLREFRGDDLEAILGELDTIINLDYAVQVDAQTKIGTQWLPVALERKTAQSLRTALKHAIIREYRNVDESKTISIYEPLFNLIFNQFDLKMLPVFTTNYDPAIEIFCEREYSNYELCDGFSYDPASRHNFWSRSTFDDFVGQSDRRKLILFKLHGSVDWLLVKSSKRMRRGQAMYDAIDSDAYENILIYPATRKIAIDDPFYTGYEYFERCCERAKLCIAIGYSFRDYDALTRLRGAASANDDFRLMLVSPDADKVILEIPISSAQKMSLAFKIENKSELLSAIGNYASEASING